ncbi:MAG TPA: hypothetical protein VGE42_10760, partial [Candidatus Dormibacteraeota bacterium]
EWKVEAPATLRAGKVTFEVVNTGTIQQELLVFRSDFPLSQYPLQSSGAIDEERAGVTKVSDGDNLDAGRSQSRTAGDLPLRVQPARPLPPGHVRRGHRDAVGAPSVSEVG